MVHTYAHSVAVTLTTALQPANSPKLMGFAFHFVALEKISVRWTCWDKDRPIPSPAHCPCTVHLLPHGCRICLKWELVG